MSADPFAKVKKMIDAMITKLLEEANEEADHKGWCDKEMATNKQTRDDKTEEVLSHPSQKGRRWDPLLSIHSVLRFLREYDSVT